MRICAGLAFTSLLLAGCGSQRDGAGADNQAAAQTAENTAVVDDELGANTAAAAGNAVSSSSVGLNAPTSPSDSKEPAAGEQLKVAAASEPGKPLAGPAGPCAMQGSERLAVAPMRAVGTEPFWSARVEGRCVTYSHPEDQKGTRIWTQYKAARGGGTWSGTLAGRPFELKIRPKPGCSDGMSDKKYGFAADVTVNTEHRSGCAEPA